jgi:L-amino acid N-acyltransferase YncA
MSLPEKRCIRPATLADLPAIRTIYNYYVLNSTCTFQLDPGSEQERLAWFQAHGEAHPVIVAEVAGEVVGWGSLSPWNPRPGYRHSVEASIYIHHQHHRQGLGRALLANLIERARRAGHHAILGGACTEHHGSLALQESLGFQRVAHLREVGHKFGRWLDVIYTQLLIRKEAT